MNEACDAPLAIEYVPCVPLNGGGGVGEKSLDPLNDAATTFETSENPTVERSNLTSQPSTAAKPSNHIVELSNLTSQPSPTPESVFEIGQPSNHTSNPICESELDEDASGDDLEDGSDGKSQQK
ncbi:hypothetical protein RND71_012075 [Anisodus tanguticus]|uniref:Uncharacterized protein n=1 Tax=Anisodus tanguticus TaxID=243964 RepID=A0AAE1SF56_9SOLA|nr:hypothetical protein RND71_012075 [Anisodus tanguticus]